MINIYEAAEKNKKKSVLIIALFFVFFAVFLIILPIVSSYAATYVGSKNSDVYHYTTCHHAERIKASNRITFPSPEDAQARGYRPCKVCTPPTTSGGGSGGGVGGRSVCGFDEL